VYLSTVTSGGYYLITAAKWNLRTTVERRF
jgi:hypothetical protein